MQSPGLEASDLGLTQNLKEKINGVNSRDHSCYFRGFKSQPSSLLIKKRYLSEDVFFLEIEQILTRCWCRSWGTELLPQDTPMAACATQAGPWQQLIFPKSVPDVTRCGMTPAVEFLEEVSPQTVPKWHCGGLRTGCLRKVLPQGPSTQGKVKRKRCRGGKASIVWGVWRPHTDKMSFQA